jgi:hypothetical protein
MLRETDKGLRYLRPTGDGDRVVQEKTTHMNLFALGGVFYNESLPYPVPLIGVNYFDYDVGGRGLQANVFFAGALALGNLSDPDILGSRLDGSVNLALVAFPSGDRLTREDPRDGEVEEIEEEEVNVKTQSLTAGIGLPFGKFFKLRASGSFSFADYSRTDDTCDDMVLPVDTWILSGTLGGEFRRRAWTISLEGSWSQRSSHEPWGLPDPVPDPSVCPPPPGGGTSVDFFEGGRNYLRYGGSVGKEFYLPLGQVVRAEVEALGGHDLDRFSKYAFGFFSSRLRGFSGAGVHFTDGVLGRVIYDFNLGEVVRFEAGIDHAEVKDRQLGEGFRSHTGIGLGGQFVGPWGLLIQLQWGYALASDIDEFRGEHEVLLAILKLFKQR